MKIKSTKVINLLGSPAVGKSTTAADVYAQMKKQGYDVELVREYVKEWAWEGRKIGQYDQIYFFGKQVRHESMLYGKVDYLITDSPIILSAFYESCYFKKNIVLPAAISFIKDAAENGVKYFDFWLERNKPFNQCGRYETEEQSNILHKKMLIWLTSIPCINLLSVGKDFSNITIDIINKVTEE